MTRRALDAYFTPAWQTRALLANQWVSGVVLEPCAGDDAIARVIRDELRPAGGVVTNDVDPLMNADAAISADSPLLSQTLGEVDWIVTNPPYTMPLCRDIVQRSIRHARVGVAMLLRLSFLEPTAKVNPRGQWLATNPPSRILVLPRYSYTQNGKSDSCTTAWMIWLKREAWRENKPCILCLCNAGKVYADGLPLGASA